MKFECPELLLQALGPNSRVVAYLPSLRTILHRLRATSATPCSLYTSPQLPSLAPSLAPILAPLTGTLLSPASFADEIAWTSLNPLLPLPGATAPVAPPTEETTPTDDHLPPVLSSSKQFGLLPDCVCV